MKNLEPLGGGEPRQDCAEGLDKIIKEMRKLLIASWPARPISFGLNQKKQPERSESMKTKNNMNN